MMRRSREYEHLPPPSEPKSRDFLQPLISEKLDNENFPFGVAKEIEIGMGLARAHRISYVGELGWELYVSTEMSTHIFDTLMKRNNDYPIKLCGLHALDSCRIEKAYRHFGHDISSEDNAIAAGLGFAVKTQKSKGKFGDFIGKQSIENTLQEGVESRMVQFVLDDPKPMLYHNEPILRDKQIVGYLTSGNFGHHIGSSIGMGYIKCIKKGETIEKQLSSHYEIDIAGKRYAAKPFFKPVYDPNSEKVKQ